MSKKKHKKKDNKFICEYCGIEHDGSYGSGRFCSVKCSKKYSGKFVTADGRSKQIALLTNPENREKGYETSRKKNHEKKIARLQEELEERTNINIGKGSLARGKIGELETTKRFLQRNIPVFLPAVDNAGIDMIAEFDGKLQKIQVKSSSQGSKDSTFFKLCRTRNNFIEGEVVHNSVGYTKDETDYFALYDCRRDELFLMENNEDRSTIILRYDNKPTNNQYCTNHAEDYEFDRVLDNIQMGIHQSDIIDADYEIVDDYDE